MARTLREELEKQKLYTACYCEENIYNLIGWLTERKEALLENLSVVFITNEQRSVPFRKQRRSASLVGVTVWDYHVMLMDEHASLLWDLDTTLDQPSDLHVYIQEALRPEIPLGEEYQRKFRVVSAASYLKNFASDRRRMKENKEWLSPPPSYPCVVNLKSEINTLDKYLTISLEDDYSLEDLFGKIMSQATFLLRINFRADRNQEKYTIM